MIEQLHRWDLWKYQHRVTEFFKDHPYCAGWIPMGGGKTPSTLTAFVDLLNTNAAKHMLVVAPLRVARKVWLDETKRWSHLQGLTVDRILGTPQQRWDALNRPAHIHCINRENLEWLECQFVEGSGKKFKQFRRWPWDVVVLDEAQSFKSQESVRFTSMRRLRRLGGYDIQRIIELTGTPAPNGYKDLWAQIMLLDQGQRLGVDEKQYIDRWFERVFHDSYTTYSLRDGAKEEIHRLLADIVLALDDSEVGSLPPRFNDIRVEMTTAEQAVYDRMAKTCLAEIREQKITAVNAGVCVGKLLQLANGAVYHDREGGWTHFHDHKIRALLECLDSSSGPVMIAYGYRHDLARIKEALTKYCGREKTWRVLDTERDEDDWNAGKIDFLLLHPASAGHGLNLQHSGSETIIWMGLTANLEWFRQLNARLIGGHRAHGRNVIIHRIITEQTYDERMIELLTDKGATEDDLRAALAQLAA